MRAAIAFSVLMLSCLLARPVESAEATPVETEIARGPFDNVVFVGRLISIQEVPFDRIPNTCTPEVARYCGILLRDSVYDARYQLLNVVSGQIDALEVRVRIWSHYGFPSFALHPEALLFAGRRDGEYTLHKYQGFAVHRTMGEGWAHCGDFQYRYVGESAPAELRPLSFAEDFGPAKQLAHDERRRKFPDGSFVAENDRIVCPRGIALGDLYELVRNGVMKSRGVDLPPMPKAVATR